MLERMGEGGRGRWGKGFHLKLDVQGQGGRTALGVNAQGGRGLEKQTIFMDVICVSSLRISEIRLL